MQKVDRASLAVAVDPPQRAHLLWLQISEDRVRLLGLETCKKTGLSVLSRQVLGTLLAPPSVEELKVSTRSDSDEGHEADLA